LVNISQNKRQTHTIYYKINLNRWWVISRRLWWSYFLLWRPVYK